jgi:hypothetical protein
MDDTCPFFFTSFLAGENIMPYVVIFYLHFTKEDKEKVHF